MNPLLEQFLSEARESLDGISAKLMQLEGNPGSAEVVGELFRLVHTLKGSSGLFDFPEMTRVLHAGEDLMDAVRSGELDYDPAMADRLLDAMDFVALLLDEIEGSGAIGAEQTEKAVQLTSSLRALNSSMKAREKVETPPAQAVPPPSGDAAKNGLTWLVDVPESVGVALYRSMVGGLPLWAVEYFPEEECFFKGEDPFHQVRQIPDIAWSDVLAPEDWPQLQEMDAYRCRLVFRILTTAEGAELRELFRYTPEQVRIRPVLPLALALPQGDPNGGPVYGDFVNDALRLLDSGDWKGLERAIRTMLELSAPNLWLSSALRWLLLVRELDSGNSQALRRLIESLRTLIPPCWEPIEPMAPPPDTAKAEIKTNHIPEALLQAFHTVLEAQREILQLPDDSPSARGRIQAVGAVLAASYRSVGREDALAGLKDALAQAQQQGRAEPLRAWLAAVAPPPPPPAVVAEEAPQNDTQAAPQAPSPPVAAAAADGEVKFGRRAEDAYNGPKTLKVEQTKIDRLMNLIGEMVVAKNGLPYLAGRAETQFGVRELSREIKTQYAVINRIAEEMQDAIMQVRMMPVSFIFQRFPRLVRDISRRLGKEINLVLEGEDTEADKNIIESLADPLIHIVRNSLDHGIELPETRRAAGKPAEGNLIIRASQESDRALIEIADDGKGIDPEIVKRKAYEKGIIDEAALDRLSDQEAVNLVFAAGFSTADVISDLSGRGVGMDVVRSAVEKVNGTVRLESEKGKGTRILLSLPLSMAVTNVMILTTYRFPLYACLFSLSHGGLAS